MNKLFVLIVFVVVMLCISTAQTVTGKLVDEASTGLAGFHLTLYSSTKTYEATSVSDGSFSFTNVETDVKQEELPIGYSVSNNYPNPFNPKTRIYVTQPNIGVVRTEVYNVLGQKVREGIEKYFNAGTSFIDYELNGLPNGFYIARITLGEKYVVTRKLLLLYGSQHLQASGSTSGSNYVSLNEETTNKALKKIALTIKIDSLVVFGPAINKNVFKSFASQPNSTNLGNIVVNTKTAGSPCQGTPTVTYSGKTYKTIQIDTQCWLKENLDVGTMIQSNQNPSNNGIIEKYCYDNKTENCNTYGGLYQWAEAVQYENGATTSTSPDPAFSGNVQGICPGGWHLPSFAELYSLGTLLISNSNELKAIGHGIGGGVGTNTTGFSALFAGYRSNNSYSNHLGFYTLFWSSTENGVAYAGSLYLSFTYSNAILFSPYKHYDFSVRCVKD